VNFLTSGHPAGVVSIPPSSFFPTPNDPGIKKGGTHAGLTLQHGFRLNDQDQHDPVNVTLQVPHQ
jgi:hypothetical protein